MCGIAGVVMAAGRGAGPVPTALLRTMADRLAHRGPDDSDVWVGEAVGLSHTRLSIIDLAGSAQPIHSPDGRWSLVFNGEIYNYADLRTGLRWPFRTAGDTEVLLAGLATEGLSFVDRLEGQFAFAAHDSVSSTTYLVRDRLGVLPLYWAETADGVAFASEVKALLPALTSPVEVDGTAVRSYLLQRAVPAPRTLFRGVRKVRPAHVVSVDATGQVHETRYWAPPRQDPHLAVAGDDELVAVLDRALRRAVSASMVADVPVGAYLSGGIDSSLIVALMSDLTGRRDLQTFSAGFGDSRTDELPWARRVSERLGTQHHEVVVGVEDFETLWSQLTWQRDAPLSEPADVAVFRLAQTARERVKVVLSGEGGDELFAGYPKYRFAALADALALVPAGPRAQLLRQVERRLPPRAERLRVAVRAAAAATASDRDRAWFSPFSSREITDLLGPDAEDAGGAGSGNGSSTDAVDRMLRGDLASWLPDNLLERGDRMSMAASLELRPPLLDHHVVELAFRMPSSAKLRGGVGKWALKEVARGYLPQDVVDRRKAGFRVPLDSWFRGGLRDVARDRLTSSTSYVGSVFDRRAVTDLLDRHDAGRSNEQMRIWTLLCLEVWHERFFSGDEASSRDSGRLSRNAGP